MVLLRAALGSAVALMFAALRVQAQSFHLQDSFSGPDFLNGFSWETFNDPSGGYVNYVDQGTAIQNNLTYTSADKFVIRVDHTKVVPQGSRGRDSIRITSHNAYADSVIVLDLQHMPGGCAQWPAFWTFSPGNWPNGGEVDIIEGIHKESNNHAALHTGDGCTMPPNRRQKGSSGDNNNCYVGSNHNAGCQTTFTGGTFGEAFNGGSGGYFAATRSASKGIAMYFWRRNDPNVPPEIRSGSQSVSPSDSWGEPEALFPTDNCDFNSHFTPHNIIINVSLCGPLASPRFTSGGCGSEKCEDYVSNNPGAFTNAYWEINSLRIYTP